MRSCFRMIGLAAAAFGLGILIGGLLPSWFVVCLLGAALLCVGVLLLK